MCKQIRSVLSRYSSATAGRVRVRNWAVTVARLMVCLFAYAISLPNGYAMTISDLQAIPRSDGMMVEESQVYYAKSVTVTDGSKTLSEITGGYEDQVTNVLIAAGVTTLPTDFGKGATNVRSVRVEKYSELTDGCSIKIWFPSSYDKIETLSLGKLSTYTTYYVPSQIPASFIDGCVSLKTVGAPICQTVEGTDWIYSLRNGEAAVGGGSSSIPAVPTTTTGVVTIPSTLWGCPVVAVSNRAFLKCCEVTSVIIPKSVRKIGQWAFSRCEKLGSIEIPNGVTNIQYQAFYNCSSLASVSLGENVGAIGEKAFENCVALTNVVFSPKRACDVDNTAFDGCSALISNSDQYRIAGSILIGINGACPNDVVVPDGVKVIAREAFYGCTNVTSVVFPQGLKDINGSAFRGCGRISQLNFPDGLCKIGAHTFYPNCYIGSSSCYVVPLLKTIRFGAGVVDIGEGAFYQQTNLVSVVSSGRFGVIGRCAFEDLYQLEEFIAKDGCKIIEEYAFLGDPKLKKFDALKDVVEIHVHALPNCGIEEIVLPESLQFVGQGAFSYCHSLTNVVFLSDDTVVGTLDNRSGYHGGINGDWWRGVFEDSEKLQNVRLPAKMKYLPAYIFSGCEALESIDIPNGVTNIDECALFDCRKITTIEIPSCVETIGRLAFYRCASLKSIVIPDLVRTLPHLVLGYCENLRTIEVGRGVTYIDEWAFADRYGWSSDYSVIFGKLAQVIFRGNAPDVHEEFIDVYNDKEFEFLVTKGSTGWGVTIPGKWKGYTIRYLYNTINFDINGGDEAVTKIECDVGDSITELPTPVRKGYDFDGWYRPDGVKIGANWSPTADETLTAKWTIHDYSITYENARGVDGGNPSTYTVNDAIKFEALPNDGDYYFLGWKPSTIDVGTTGDVSVTACWARVSASYTPSLPWNEGYERILISYEIESDVDLSALDDPYGLVRYGNGPIWYANGSTTNRTWSVWWTDYHGVLSNGQHTATYWLYSDLQSQYTNIDLDKHLLLGLEFSGEIGMEEIDETWSCRGAYSGQYVHDDEGYHYVDRRKKEVRVAGSGEISFCWDWYQYGYESAVGAFYIDGVQVATCYGYSGSRDRQVFRLGAGQHTVKWEFYNEYYSAAYLEVSGIEWHPDFSAKIDIRTPLTRVDIPLTEYQITYDDDHGVENPNPASYTITNEVTFAPLTPPAGWRFVGWSPAKIEKGSTGDKTVTAQWEQIKYTVDIDGVAESAAQGGCVYGQSVTAATFAEKTEGYTNVVCRGWVGTGDVPATGVGTQVTFTVTQTSSLKWVYQTNYWVQVEVEKVGGGGEIGGSVALYDAERLRVHGNSGWFANGTNLTAEATAAEGWLFAGWRDVDESGTIASMSEDFQFAVDAPVFLEALFTQKVFTVAYENLKGAVNPPENPSHYTIASETVTFSPLSTVDGFSFLGWDPAEIVKGSIGDKVVTAQWQSLPTPSWPVPQSVFENSQTIYARIYDKSAKSYLASTNGWLGVFDSAGVIRGRAQIKYSPLGYYMFKVDVGFDGQSVGGLVLKYWEPKMGERTLRETVSLSVGTDVGYVDDPYVYNVGLVAVEFELSEGYTWISVPLELEDACVTNVFASCGFANRDKITTQGAGSASYIVSEKYTGWYPADYAIEPGKTYVVKKSSAGKERVSLEGERLATTAEVLSGWNWIGSCSDEDVAVASVGHSGSFANRDKISAQAGMGSTSYLGANGSWWGDLETLKPCVGYKFKLANAGTLSFGSGSENKSDASKVAAASVRSPVLAMGTNKNMGDPGWTMSGAFENAQDVYARIYDPATKSYVENDLAKLAVFLSDGTCLGVSGLKPSPLGYKLFQVQVGFDGSSISGVILKYWDPDRGMIILQDKVTIVNGTDIGFVDEPVVYELVPTTVIAFDAGGVAEIDPVIATNGLAMPVISIVPTKPGYAFTGFWDADIDGMKYYNADLTGAKNWDKTDAAATLYAQWEQIKYAVDIDGVVEGDCVYGESVTAATVSEKTEGLTNIVCCGWVGTGDVPATGVGTQVTFTVTQASSLKWLYQTNYWVQVEVEKVGGGGEIGGSVALYDAERLRVHGNSGWFANGTNLTAEATAAEGWLFSGWRDVDESGTIASGKTNDAFETNASTYAFDVDAPVFLEAVFTQKVFAVTFDLGEHGTRTGGGVLEQTVVYGESAIAPTVAPTSGYVFTGWDRTFDNVTEAMTVKAVYEAIVYAITYAETKDVEHSNPTNYTIETDEIVFAPLAAPAGWRFLGWSPAKVAKGSTGDVTVTAQWEQIKYRVDIGGVVDNTCTNGQIITVETFAAVTNGYTNVVCVGWVGTGDVPATGTGTQCVFSVTQASSLKWVYQTNYWVSVSAREVTSSTDAGGDGAAGVRALPACEGGSVVLKDAAGAAITNELWAAAGTNLSAEATANEGWFFAGWFSRSAPDSGAQESARGVTSSTVLTVDAPIFLEAVFTQKVFAVTFDLGAHGTRTGGGELSQSVAYGESAVAPEVTAASGYGFAGWVDAQGVTNTSDVVTSRVVTSDLTFTAAYQVGVYSIAYAETKCVENPNPTAYTVDDQVTFAPLMAPAGWRFLGWSPAKIAKGSTGDVTVTAQWEQIKYSVDIDGVVDNTCTNGQVVTAETFAAVTNGYTNVVCVGWVGTGDVPANGTGTRCVFTVTQESSLKWVYQTNYWVSVSAREVTSSTDAGGDGAAGVRALPACVGGSVVLKDAAGAAITNELWAVAGTNLTAEATANEGWFFAGWFSRSAPDSGAQESARGVTSSTVLTVDAPVFLEAVFTQKVFAVTFDLGGHGTRTGGGALEQTVVYGESAIAPTVKANLGYVFVGWMDADGSFYASDELADYCVQESVTFTAVYEKATGGAAGEAVVIAAPETTLGGSVTWSAKGLPTGMKIATKNLLDKTFGSLSGGTLYGTPTKPGSYVVRVTAKSGKSTETFDVEVTVGNYVDETLPLDDSYGSYLVGAKVCLELGSEFTGCKVSGLPSGLKFAAKETKDSVFGTVAAGTVYGVPTKPCTNAVVFTKTVSESVGGKAKKVTHTASATFAVAAAPAWSIGTFNGRLDDGSGSVTLTVATSGKVSGKIVTGGKTWSFTPSGFEEIEVEKVGGGGEWTDDLEVVATAKSGKATALVQIAITCDGATGSITGDDLDAALTLWRNAWKDKGATAKLAPFVGLYTVQLAGDEAGYGYLSLTLDAKGNCKATGKLPDGTTASGTLPLVWSDGAPMAIWQIAPSAYKGGHVGGLLTWEDASDAIETIASTGKVTGEDIAWISKAPAATGEYGEGFSRTMSASGAYYNKLAALAEYYSGALTFSADAPALDATVKTTDYNDNNKRVTTSETAQIDASVLDCWGLLTISLNDKGAFAVDQKATKPTQDKTTKEWAYTGANDAALTFGLTKATGIFKGSFTCWYDYVSATDNTKDPVKETVAHASKKVSYEGVMILGESLRGFYLWDRIGSYEDEKTGKAKTYKYKESRPVSFE